MRLVIQRVKRASVSIEGAIFSSIESGLLILIGIEEADGKDDVEYLSKKTAQLRIFDDANGVMNCSVMDVSGGLFGGFAVYPACRYQKGEQTIVYKSSQA